MWIKICGNTNVEDALLALEGGADALGFVFAPSPRQVTAAQVSEIAVQLPQQTERIGVFADHSFSQIVSIVDQAALTGVQLHVASDSDLPLRLREHFAGFPSGQVPGRLRILRVLNYPAAPNHENHQASHSANHRASGNPGQSPIATANSPDLASEFEAEVEVCHRDGAIDGVLVDSRTATAIGGTGIRFDWQSARASFSRVSPQLRVIVAGGLSPENVAEAIGTLRPWGVDVVSGVEARPGKKDRSRVLGFIHRARAAAHGMLTEAEDGR